MLSIKINRFTWISFYLMKIVTKFNWANENRHRIYFKYYKWKKHCSKHFLVIEQKNWMEVFVCSFLSMTNFTIQIFLWSKTQISHWFYFLLFFKYLSLKTRLKFRFQINFVNDWKKRWIHFEREILCLSFFSTLWMYKTKTTNV